MKFELGPWRPDLLADMTRPGVTQSSGTNVSQSNNRVVDRFNFGGTQLLAAEEVTVEGRSNGPLSQTDSLHSSTLILKDGSRVLFGTASDGAWAHDFALFGTPFIDGFYALMLGRDDQGAFANRYLGGDDNLIGNAGPNVFYGGAGRDRIQAGAGADLIDGGAGVDTSVYRELAHSDYVVTRLSNGTVFVSTRDGSTDRNTNVENLEFSDGTLPVSSIAYLPGYTAVADSAVQPVYRFYNSRDKAFFYTASAAERDMIIRESTDPSFNPGNGLWPYFYQGATYEQAHSSAGSVPVFRFYNFNTGHHFFTTSVAERDMVLKESSDPNFGQPGLWPFNYEGEGFRAFASPAHKDATPVYRFYSPGLDRHFFTGSAEEAAQIRLTGQWNDEGIGYWGEVPG
jgi:hypothetical protein